MQLDFIIQARTGSTRLPGKVLKPLQGVTILERVVNQALKIKNISRVIVATSENPKDKAIADFCKQKSIPFFRGSEDDLLKRYSDAGKLFGSSVIVRGTGDNPFLDPDTADKLIDKHLLEENDYTFSVGFPLGTACEVFNSESLNKVNKMTNNPVHHEHIGTFFLDQSSDFKVGFLKAPKEFYYPNLRLTVDTAEDFLTAENFVNNLDHDFTLADIISLSITQPDLIVNKSIQQIYPTENIKKMFQGENPL